MRQRSDVVIAPVYLAILLTSTAMILPVATTWVRSDADAILGTLVWSVQLMAIFLVATQTARPPRAIPLGAAVLLNAFLMGVVAMSVSTWVLGGRGERCQATVVEVYDHHSAPATYTLAVDHVPVPGRLTGWPGGGTGALGDEVLVVRDPKGLVDPRLPDDLAEAVETDIKILILPIVGILAVLCLAAVSPFGRGRRSPDAGLERLPDEKVLRQIDRVLEAAADLAVAQRVALTDAVVELRFAVRMAEVDSLVEDGGPDLGEVVKAAGALRAVAERIGIASVSAAADGVVRAVSALAAGDRSG
jgi:hypothetical protein